MCDHAMCDNVLHLCYMMKNRAFNVFKYETISKHFFWMEMQTILPFKFQYFSLYVSPCTHVQHMFSPYHYKTLKTWCNSTLVKNKTDQVNRFNSVNRKNYRTVHIELYIEVFILQYINFLGRHSLCSFFYCLFC